MNNNKITLIHTVFKLGVHKMLVKYQFSAEISFFCIILVTIVHLIVHAHLPLFLHLDHPHHHPTVP